MSYRKARNNLDVKNSTLHDFIKRGGVKSAGGPTLLSAENEKAIAELVDTVAEWGYSVGPMEIKLTHMPGNDWFAGFMRKNKISTRYTSNIKLSRSKFDAEDITSFFKKLEKTLKEAGIEELIPENNYNYDETNFTNDPGKTPVIVRRSPKRVENCQEVSKQSFSVMWCGSTSRELLPPMVVYKAMNCYEGWVQGGPKNVIYDSTNTGWFLIIFSEYLS